MGSSGRRSPGRDLAIVAVVTAIAAGAGGYYAGWRQGRSAAPPRSRATVPATRSSPAGRGADAGADARTAPQAPHLDARPVTQTSGNFLVNAGFEDGAAGWKWLDWSQEWAPFEIAEGTALSGSRSAHLPVRGGPADRPTRVYGVVQEIAPQVFPEVVSGHYRVDRWQTGGVRKAYLQMVVIAIHPEGNLPSTQVRYILEGVTEPPYDMSNARYRFVHSRAEPPIGQWIDFSVPVRQDFLDLWGKTPPPGTALRILFEARYDDKSYGRGVEIDAFYDDLFAGVP